MKVTQGACEEVGAAVSAGRVSDVTGYSLRWHEPLVLLAGVALGLLVPTLHSATLVRTGSSLGMDDTDRAASQINGLQSFRAVATRFDKWAYVFHSTVTVAANRLWLQA